MLYKYLSNKMVSLLSEPMYRDVQPIDLMQIDSFGGFENLMQMATPVASQNLSREVDKLNKEFPALQNDDKIRDLFYSGELRSRIQSDSTCRYALALMSYELVEAGQYYRANVIARGLVEGIIHQRGKYVDGERISFQILTALSESHFQERMGAFKRLASVEAGDENTSMLLLYFSVRDCLRENDVAQATELLSAFSVRKSPISFALFSILTAEVAWQENNMKVVSDSYREINKVLEKYLESLNTSIEAYPRVYSRRSKKCFGSGSALKTDGKGAAGVQKLPQGVTRADIELIQNLELVNTLRAAYLIKQAAFYDKRGETKKADNAYAEAEKCALTNSIPLRIPQHSKQTLLLVLGERCLRRGDAILARQFFEESGDCLHALTRLNELDFARLEKLTSDQSNQVISRLYREEKLREELGDSEGLTLARLHRFAVAQKINDNRKMASSLGKIVESEKKSPIAVLALMRLAQLPQASEENRRQAARANIFGDSFQLTTMLEAFASRLLFGDFSDELVDHLFALRDETRSNVRAELKEALNIPPTALYKPLLDTYRVREKEIRGAFAQFWEQTDQVFEFIFTNPFKALEASGFTSYSVVRDGEEIVLRLDAFSGWNSEIVLGPDFRVDAGRSVDFNNLLELVIMDSFLIGQRVGGYEAALPLVPVSSLIESDWLNLDGLRHILEERGDCWKKRSHVAEDLSDVVEHPPSESEATLDNMEEHVLGSGEVVPEEEEVLEKRLEEQEAVLDQLVLPNLTKGRKYHLDIPRLASFDPLAKLLFGNNGKGILSVLPDGLKEVRIESPHGVLIIQIHPNKKITLADENRGEISIGLWLNLRVEILELINLTLSQEYQKAVAENKQNRLINRLISITMNTPQAKEEKRRIFGAIPAVRQPFVIKGVEQGENPFAATFFESKDDGLTPLPDISLAEAVAAVKEGRSICQILIISSSTPKFRSDSLKTHASEEQIKLYILWEIMNEKKMLSDATALELAEVDRIAELIKAKRKFRVWRKGELVKEDKLKPDSRSEYGLSFNSYFYADGVLDYSIYRGLRLQHVRRSPIGVTGHVEFAQKPKPRTKQPTPPPAKRGGKKKRTRANGKNKRTTKGPSPKPPQAPTAELQTEGNTATRAMIVQAAKNIRARKALALLEDSGRSLVDIARLIGTPLGDLVKLKQKKHNIHPAALRKLESNAERVEMDLDREEEVELEEDDYPGMFDDD